ncbi:MAG TPA: hypothetical protein VH415_06305 [Nitrososphaeraceae archaeon]|jgi:hypothetical protein
MVLARRDSILLAIILVSLIITGLNVSAEPTLLTSTFAADDKDCKNNDGGNNCNNTKKSASPELECKHQIKDNKDSSIDSQCTNNSQILIDSNIDESPSDGDTGPELRPNITLNPTSGQVDTLVHITGVNFHVEDIVTITFNDISIATTPAIVTTNPMGEFSASFRIPGDATEGVNTVTAIDDERGQASAGFNVEVP